MTSLLPADLTEGESAENADDATLFLSRISAHAPHFVNTNRVRDWADQTQVHRAVMSLFPSELPGDGGERRATSSILYRVDVGRGGATVLVQSACAPLAIDGLETTDAAVLLEKLTAGSAVRFRVKANVVRSASRSSKLVPVRDFSAQIDWLTDRFAPGFLLGRVDDARTAVERGGKHPIHTVTFDGVASVADADAARAIVVDGIGRSRAFGCGLVSVIPL